MKLTYICSPCRGDYEKNIIKAQEYCREAMNDGLLPLAPHVYFTQFVDDSNPEERKLGLRCGLQLLRYCQLIRVYGCEVSAGMYDEIQLAGVLDIEIQVFGPPPLPLLHTPISLLPLHYLRRLARVSERLLRFIST